MGRSVPTQTSEEETGRQIPEPFDSEMVDLEQGLPEEDTDMEELTLASNQLPDTVMTPPADEARIRGEGVNIPHQVPPTQDMDERDSEWEEWDDDPLGLETLADNQDQAYRL